MPSTFCICHKPLWGGGPLASLLLVSGTLLLASTAAYGTPLQAEEQQEEETYQRARDLNLRGQWEQALELFRLLARGDSPRAAEAAFYEGLCLENLPGRDEEAFQVFIALRLSQPDDPFAAKALSHQITLAGVLGEKDSSYREFLAEHLGSDDPAVRREAALSLARFGDERAAEVLLEILREGTTDQKMTALERITYFELSVAEHLAKDAATTSPDPDVQMQAETLQESLSATSAERQRMERMLTRDKKLLMETIKLKGENWTDKELLTHALFHVMPRRTFARYVQGNQAEQLQIYEEFFDDLDRRNRRMSREELEGEFQRRITYAFETFSEPWRAARSRYDAKEWLTPNNPYSPWDARGELYIRYGEPSDIFILGNNIVEWYYARMRVDFTIHQYRLNFLLNAIYPGRASQQDYPAGHVQANYINTPRIEF